MILFYSLKPDFTLHRLFFILDFPCEDFLYVKKADKIIFIMLALMDLYVCALGGWHIKAPELPLIISSLTLVWNFHDGSRDIREKDLSVSSLSTDFSFRSSSPRRRSYVNCIL